MKPFYPNEVSRILVAELQHHGDVLLASPVFHVLKKIMPHAEIDALIYKETLPMLEAHPDVAQILTINRDWKKNIKTQIQKEWALFLTLKKRKYDLIIHLTDHRRLSWLVRLLKPKYSVGDDLPNRFSFWNKSFTHLKTVHNAKRHTVEKNLDALRALRLAIPNEKNLIFIIPQNAHLKIETLLKENQIQKKEYLHIHPASRWFFKCWQAENVAKIIEYCQNEHIPVVLTSSADEKEKQYLEKILSFLKSKENLLVLSGNLTLKELGAVILNARLFFGVDSAPMHIAAALNIPSVVLFGPSGDLEWSPWMAKENYQIIQKKEDFPCRPCGKAGCGGGKISDCLLAITSQEVWGAIQKLF